MLLTRRSLLECLSATAVAPYLAPLVARAEAEARGGRPQRFVFFIEGNGVPATHLQPVGIDRVEVKHPAQNSGSALGATGGMNGAAALIDRPLSAPGVSLPEPLAPLAPHLRRVTILQGLSGRVCGGGHGNGFGTLGCYPANAGAKDITIDAALSRTAPAIHQHVALGVKDNLGPAAPPIFTCCSASGPNTKVPHYQDPALAYDMLFGRIMAGNTAAALGSQAMLLDFIAGDLAALQRHLPLPEAEKIERYADAFAAIKQRRARLGDIDPGRIPPRRGDLYASDLETKRLEAHVEVAATALLIGLTNTVTICSGAGSYPTWKGLGITIDNHAIGHNQVAGAAEMMVKIRQYNMGLIASLVSQLEAVPEGDGTVMDNTLIVYLSDSAELHHSKCYEWPMVLVGNLGGRLAAGDRFLNVPGYAMPGHVTVAQFFTALLHASGAPVNHFGMMDRLLQQQGLDQKQPFTEILA